MSYMAEEKIKLAGEDSKDRLYEAKQNQKAIRILTVAAYVLCVSLVAIMLSLYYIFLWDPSTNQINAKTQTVDNIVIPDNLAIQLANRSEVPAELFYTNLYRHLIHSKTIKARKSAAVRESSNLTRLIQLYHQQKEINENDVYVQSELEQLVDASASSASQSSVESTQPPSSASDAMMADEDDGGDDYEQSGNYGLYSNHTTIQLDQDDALQQ
ncbi:AAEL014278-PA [Aedes aegypti]|uniref:AAEL014278-PA n=1 Tax=Aedes aegypti TaxID=7159 RepID=Q16GS8_AEDAE|nr:AAEL014278-PA [Aedes aegypti]